MSKGRLNKTDLVMPERMEPPVGKITTYQRIVSALEAAARPMTLRELREALKDVCKPNSVTTALFYNQQGERALFYKIKVRERGRLVVLWELRSRAEDLAEAVA